MKIFTLLVLLLISSAAQAAIWNMGHNGSIQADIENVSIVFNPLKITDKGGWLKGRTPEEDFRPVRGILYIDGFRIQVDGLDYFPLRHPDLSRRNPPVPRHQYRTTETVVVLIENGKRTILGQNKDDPYWQVRVILERPDEGRAIVSGKFLCFEAIMAKEADSSTQENPIVEIEVKNLRPCD